MPVIGTMFDVEYDNKKYSFTVMYRNSNVHISLDKTKIECDKNVFENNKELLIQTMIELEMNDGGRLKISKS